MSPYLEKLTAIDISKQPARRRKDTWRRWAEAAFVLFIVLISVAGALYVNANPPGA